MQISEHFGTAVSDNSAFAVSVKCLHPSHLVLLQLVLVGVLALALPPQLLQLRVGSVEGVLLHLVLHLVPFKGGLKTERVHCCLNGPFHTSSRHHLDLLILSVCTTLSESLSVKL